MFRAMIIDDEEMICNGLKTHLLRGGYGFTEIYTAGNGMEALEILENNPVPQLILTDISMPQMNGIELLTILRDRGISSRVIVLSGYNDFEYVRSMAVLGIENYLLKPVSDEELRQTILGSLTKLENEQRQHTVNQLNEDLIRENIINRWIYGSIGESELTERAEFLNLDLESTYFQPCILRLLGNNENKNTSLKQQIYELCSQILSDFPNCYFSRNYNGDTIAVFCLEQEDVSSAIVSHALNTCLSSVNEQLSVKPYLLLGNMVEGYWNVAASFQEALSNGFYQDSLSAAAFPEASEEGADSSSSPFSYRLANYVLEHFHEELTLKTLAAHFKGNAAYIGQTFKRDIHKPFTEYLKYVRLEKAKEMLIKSDASAKEIAEKVGFQNATYFCTVFKKETGLSPAEYRKKMSG